jgi:microsomal dipeptidase-like Zn-dependent dipeptidase
LLSYCVDAPGRTAYDREVRCSLGQLRAGDVALQVLAVFTATEKDSVLFAEKQVNYFADLLKKENKEVAHVKNKSDLSAATANDKTGIALALENASGFCDEEENLEYGLKRLEKFIQTAGSILYIGLTHHLENRFAGGNNAQAGLKPDGKILLEYLSGKGICIDLAHTSRQTSADILDYTFSKSLDLKIIDSHSNFNRIFEHPRNQTDEIAKEIAKRGGVIGLNFLKDYIGATYKDIFKHIEHALFLGLENHLALGADYFYVEDEKSSPRYPYYFAEMFASDCYPYFAAEMIRAGFSHDIVSKIAYRNVFEKIVKD